MKINHLPLTELEHDLLNFGPKSKEIARYINDFPYDVPCAISIDGAWGTGKSTMLNYTEKHIDSKKCYIIRFNPWALSDKEQILFSLFEEIYDCIDDGYTNAKNKFFEYAQKLSKPVSKIATYFAQTNSGIPHQVAMTTSEATSDVVSQVTRSFFEKPISKRRNEVEKELKLMVVENKKKIVVFIDEIDRMFPDEVIQIFQAIKSVLDLPGLMFVVAIDRESITDSLLKADIKRPDDYLQKIFQQNFHSAPRHQLKTLCRKVLLPAMEKSSHIKELRYLIDTFVEHNKENYRKPRPEEKEEDANYMHLDKIEQRIEKSYLDVYDRMRDRFENPRKFVKLTNYFVLKWDEYSEYLKTTIEDNKVLLQASFLLFVTIFDYGDKLDFNLMDTYPKDDKYLLAVISHLQTYKLDDFHERKLGVLVRNSMMSLSIFPDLNEQFGIE